VKKLRGTPLAWWHRLTFPGALYYLAVAAFFTSAAGIFFGNKYVLPALDVVGALPALAWVRLRRRFHATAYAVLFWAFWKTAAVAFFTVLMPARAAAAVAWGRGYAGGTLLWLSSGADIAGVGAATALRLKPTLLLAGASLFSAGVGGLVAAAALLNCQAYYFGVLLSRAVAPWRVLAFGWPLWELLRAFGLANILVAAAGPGVMWLRRRPFRGRDVRDGIFVGLLMLAAAFVARAALAPWWRALLEPGVLF